MKKYLFLLFVIVLISCSAKKNTFLSRNYHMLTTRYNVYFNGSEAMKAGEKKIAGGHKDDYSKLLPIYLSEDEAARSAAFSDMDRASVKAMKAIKLHSITNKPKRKSKPSKKYIEFRKKKEFNSLLDECYLLKGRADYYNKKYQMADKAFKFIIRRFPNEEIVFDARLWYGRSLIEQKKFPQAKEQLRSLNKKDVPEKYNPEILKLSAYYGLKTNNEDFAINNLENLIPLLKRAEKARFCYILAQLLVREGANSRAMLYFEKVANMRVSYEMVFNAMINKAIAYTGSGQAELLRELTRMLNNKKNKDYRDQIYYALANVYMKNGDINQSVDYYWKSIHASVNNNNQKSLSFKVLGSYYYEIKDYRKSHLCYDSCYFYNSECISISETIKKRRNSLAILVDGLNVVSVQDSLRVLAGMSEKDRNEIIDAKIEEIRQKSEFQREQNRKADLDRSFYLQNGSGDSGFRNSYSSTGGGWYFYNPAMISGGRAEFNRIWGRRKLEDNWNRKNKAIVENVEGDGETEGLGEKNDGKDAESERNPELREYYLQDIPLTKAQIVTSDSLILETLFSVGDVYSTALGDFENAISVYEDVIRRYPDNKYLLYIYYSCYNCAKQLGDIHKKEFYKSKIIKEFPKSEYAKLVVNGTYLFSMQNEMTKVDDLYKNALAAYERREYSRTALVCDQAILNYPKSELRDKLVLLRLYSLAKYMSPGEIKMELKKLLGMDLGQEAKDVVSEIATLLNSGGVSYKSVEDNVENVTWINTDKGKYTFHPESSHYFILSMPRTAKNLDKLLFELNLVCADAIETNLLDIQKEMLGDNTLLFVVKVLKNKEEADFLHKEMVKDKELIAILDGVDYRMFSISENNYKTLRLLEDQNEYLKYYSEKYFGNTNDIIGSVNRENILFKYVNDIVHDFVILFPFKTVDDDNLKAALEKYDSDYKIEFDNYSKKYQAIIVRNVGYSTGAMEYYSSVRAFLNKNYSDIFPFLKMMVISSDNYREMYENKFDREYLTYFKTHYKEVDKTVSHSDSSDIFSYTRNEAHYFVIYFPDSVNENKLLSVFKKYNTNNLPVEIRKFDRKNKVLIVSNLANKKQGMIYYRAVLSNKSLYRELKSVKYLDFIISENNFEKLTSKDILDKYFELFNKWYLNK